MSPTLHPWDYTVIGLVTFISVCIGVYVRYTAKSKTPGEFLMANRSMGKFPVVFSLAVTKLSAIALIGESSDAYLYGTQRCIAPVFVMLGCLAMAYVFMPVYFAVGAPTIYEFLEQRYGRKTRRLLSVLCYFHTLLNMSVVIFTPSIAISSVTPLSIHASFWLVGGVCIVFSAMGGLKGVMWADVFQATIMYGSLLVIVIHGTYLAGGPAKVFQAAHEGERLEIINFAGDPRTPYTFWNSLSYGFQYAFGHTVNQFEVQRLLAVRKLEDAQSASVWSIIPSWCMAFLTTSAGLVLFAVFRDCDPLSAESGTGLTKPDQIVPFYAVSLLAAYPGLAGLCISGILCASTSTLSSALNSLSTVVVEDFIPSFWPTTPGHTRSKFRMYLLAKALVLVHGVLIIGLTYLTSQFTNVLQGVVVLDGMILGPSLAVFLMGMVTCTTNETGVLIGLCAGGLFSAWFGLGSSLFAPVYPGKPVSIEGCSWNATQCCAETFRDNTVLQTSMQHYFPLHGISYVWTYLIGFALTASISYLASMVMNCYKRPTAVPPHLLCPLVTRRFQETELCLGK